MQRCFQSSQDVNRDAFNHILQQCIMCGVCVAVLYVMEPYGTKAQLDSGVFNCGGKVCTEVAKGEGGGR